MRVETVKAFFYRQNSHEIVFLVFLPTAASSQEAFCFSETENVEVLSDSIAQMGPIQLKFHCSAIDTIWDRLVRLQPIRSEYLW